MRVNGDVYELPADAARAMSSIAMDAVTDSADTSQLLDVHIDQLAGVISLIPDDRFLGLEALEPGQAMASQGSFVETVALDTSSLTDLGPDGQQTLPVNNVLRNEI